MTDSIKALKKDLFRLNMCFRLVSIAALEKNVYFAADDGKMGGLCPGLNCSNV